MRLRTAVAVVLWAGIAIAVSVVVLMKRSETTKAYYATPAAADKDGAFERGWLPDVLKEHASEIHEEHDIDTNHGWVTFRYSYGFADKLEHDCVRWPPNEPVYSPFLSWPEFLRKGDTAADLASRKISVFRSGGFVSAINSDNQGFFWH